MVIPITLPATPEDLVTFALWDRDLIRPNEHIAEMTIPIGEYTKRVFDTDQAVRMYDTTVSSVTKRETKDDKVVRDCYHNKKGGKSEEKCGSIRFSFEILPLEVAKLGLVGQGRSEPNVNPYLPPPVGRIHWSLNPFTMLEQLLGPVARRRLICCCYTLICLTLFVFSAPTIFGNMVTKIMWEMNIWMQHLRHICIIAKF